MELKTGEAEHYQQLCDDHHTCLDKRLPTEDHHTYLDKRLPAEDHHTYLDKRLLTKAEYTE